MIIVGGQIPIQADKFDQAVQHMNTMMEATLKEDGCIIYQFSADFTDKGTIHLFEVWDSQDALDKHFHTPHMAEYRKANPEFANGKSAIKIYEVSSVRDL